MRKRYLNCELSPVLLTDNLPFLPFLPFLTFLRQRVSQTVLRCCCTCRIDTKLQFGVKYYDVAMQKRKWATFKKLFLVIFMYYYKLSAIVLIIDVIAVGIIGLLECVASLARFWLSVTTSTWHVCMNFPVKATAKFVQKTSCYRPV